MSAVVVSARVRFDGETERSLRSVKGVVVAPSRTGYTGASARHISHPCEWKPAEHGFAQATCGVTLGPSLGREHVAVAVQGVVEALFDYTEKRHSPHIGTPVYVTAKGKLGVCGNRRVGYFLQYTGLGRALVYLTHTRGDPPTERVPCPPPRAPATTHGLAPDQAQTYGLGRRKRPAAMLTTPQRDSEADSEPDNQTVTAFTPPPAKLLKAVKDLTKTKHPPGSKRKKKANDKKTTTELTA